MKAICLLQETHSYEIDEREWKSQFNGEIFFSHGTCNSRGVAILIPDCLPYDVEVKNIRKDSDGRVLLINLEIEKNPIVIINLYAPTKDNAAGQNDFIEKLNSLVEEYSDKPLIIGGDFNICLNLKLDKKGGVTEEISSYRNKVLDLMEEFDLVDIWRHRNLDKNQYTWRGKVKQGLVQSRLDFFLVSGSLEQQVNSADICPGLKSDHSLINVSIDIVKINKRGRGTWKFNNALLKDTMYISKMKETIHSVISSYNSNNKNMVWEYLKCQIRTDTMIYASEKAKLMKKEELDIARQIAHLEQNLDHDEEPIVNKYYELKNKWESIKTEKTNGIILRSKARFVEEGEKNSKYFLNLEKRNYRKKHMKAIINSEGDVINKPDEILKEQASFYKKLYTTGKNKVDNRENARDYFLKERSVPQLSDEENKRLDAPLTITELSSALKEMANNKSPGLDGFTTNFYKFFWADLKTILFESYLYSRKTGSLSDGQRRGILSLIPKKDRDLRYLKSWRPVSLLATDYKILAKALANRLQKVIGLLIHPDQVGYIKGRFIGENIRIIEDVMQYTTQNGVAGLIVLIDFEKAFDTIEWDFLFDALKSYNIGSVFLSWVKLLYSDITSCTINNGYLSNNFELSRGIRQGCPISALLFILVAEILSIKLRAYEKAKGITINKVEFKICQLADDTTIFAKDLMSLQAFISQFTLFQNLSGLKLNLEKSEIIPLGPYHLAETELPESLSMLKINRNEFKTLGIWFCKNPQKSEHLNLDNRLEKMKNLIKIWKLRNLSWIGRIMIIKTIIISQITHLLSAIYIPDSFLKELDRLIYSFLWNDKPAKIKNETISAPLSEGGLKMINIFTFHIAQKCMWIKRICLDNMGKWGHLFLTMCGITKACLDHKLSANCLDRYQSTKYHNQVLRCWFQIKARPPNSTIEILNEYICYRYIRIGGGVIQPEYFGKHCIEENLSIKIHNLLNSNNNIGTLEEIQSNFNFHLDTFRITALIHAIPREWKV